MSIHKCHISTILTHNMQYMIHHIYQSYSLAVFLLLLNHNYHDTKHADTQRYQNIHVLTFSSVFSIDYLKNDKDFFFESKRRILFLLTEVYGIFRWVLFGNVTQK